jgi:hypothetical protein
MNQENESSDAGLCRFIDSQDRRCSNRFSLGRLGEVFSLCVNNHDACSVYQQIWEEENSVCAQLTIAGEPVGAF